MDQVKKFPVYKDKRSLYTKNIYPGVTHFAERVIQTDAQYREFLPQRSKLAAAIVKGISQMGIKENSTVLYLGASHGYTCSFVSDMVGPQGVVFAIDHSPRVVRDLFFVAQQRKNIIPLLGNCMRPNEYAHRILAVDVLFQDIAQKNQVEIFLKNTVFLKQGGFGLLSIKARSIDVVESPPLIFKRVRSELQKHIAIVDYADLEPFERDHALFVVKKA